MSVIMYVGLCVHTLLTKRLKIIRGIWFTVCLFVCLFGQRFLDNPRADSRHILHAGVAWVRTCLLPFWGLAGRAEKEANEIFVTMGVNGEFLHFGGF